MSIRREDLTPEWVAEVTALIKAHGYDPLSEEERNASRAHILAQVPPAQDVWLFGYGSLMWNPMVHFLEQCDGLLHGYHRRFCFWVRSGRGTPEMPGLMLALDRGGSCRGMAFRIAGRKAAAELKLLWMREMLGGIYEPRWVNVRTAKGTIRAVTFVVRRDHPQYIQELAAETAASHIARAKGWLDSSRNYLENTIAHLTELGFSDSYLNRLLHLVKKEGAD